MTLYSC